MNENMTIEAFFLADYQRLKKENDHLKERINKHEKERVAAEAEGGFSDLGAKVEAVMYEVGPGYYIFDNEMTWGKLNVEQLKALLDMGDDGLFNKATEARKKWGGAVVTNNRKTFPFSVAFSSYKGTKEYAYDPDRNATELVEVLECAELGSWVNARLDADCKALAVEDIRDKLRERIEKLEKEIGEA